MKSYTNHLKDTKSYGEELSVEYHPTMRSSAIFPCIKRNGKIKSIYTFMGYWLRKRNISIITAVVTLRDSKGKKVAIKSYEVKSVKSYIISTDDLIDDEIKDFFGSVEIEIFSAVDMVFPYPAITFAIKGINGITFVHTCGRIYNSFEDLKDNNEAQVPETGFDILIGRKYEPFFAFVNGPIAIENREYKLEFIDLNGNIKFCTKSIKRAEPFSLVWVNLFDEELNHLNFKSKKICVKIHHDFEGFFPRFVAGNVLNDYEDISLTHTYYDTSNDTSDGSIYRNPSKNKFFDSTACIPFDNSFSEVELAIYPIFTFSPATLKFLLYNSNGILLETSDLEIIIANNKEAPIYLKFMEIFFHHSKKIKNGMVKIIFDGQGSVPTRMKFGLNLINKKNKSLPSNVCFNSNVPNIKIIDKPNTFRWCAIFDQSNQKIFLHNTSFIKDGFRSAKILVEVYREKDDAKLSWELNLKYNGTVEIIETNIDKIKDFLDGSLGWVSFFCTSPFVLGYYVTDFEKGIIGADHIY